MQKMAAESLAALVQMMMLHRERVEDV